MLQYRAAILILLGWIVIALAGRPSRASPKYTDWRLPRSVLPRQYKLRLLPFLDGNFTTSGYVEILLECMQDTQLVVLHMSEITIAKEGLQIHDLIESRRVNIQSYIEDKTRQLLVIGTKNETLRKGMFYRLTIQFVSQLNENLNGFYRANYVDGGVKKYLATTQFSPTDARKAFPCFDEPGMKARFQITLGRKKSRKSHSNMPIKQTIPHEKLSDYVWDEYETTLPMSTYILAFIVSEFEGLDPIIEADSKLYNRVRFQFWARPSSLKQTEYARTLGPKVLEFFETFFNISFPLPKLDMFAIPDFAVGAMENWGLITYRETSLLYDPLRSSSLNKQRVATVIAHELAHQWFGNLVTMAWWSDLWLKEGFASYLEFVGSDAADASLQVGQQFTVEKMHVVFSVDALATSHPMSMPVNKRNEVNELFDSIPYAKGPSVIRMLAAFLGQNNFRNGLTLYLNNKKYQNAVQDDLWTAFDSQTNNNSTSIDLPASVETIMNSWSLQSGYPIVTVRRDYENQSAILTQERFYLLPNQNSSDDFPLWWIPLTFTSDFKATYSAWMMGTEDGIELELAASPTDWIIFNVDQLGYYRVNYDDRNWKMITDQLQEDHLEVPVLNRAQLLDDGLNVARIGEVSYRIILELTRYLRSERDYVPWRAALSAFDYVDRMLYSTPGKDKFREYLKWIITPVFQEIGFNQKKNDSHLTILNRDQILSWACKLGIPECVKNATALYKSWMNQSDNQQLIHSNYKQTIICAAIANNGDEEWDFALERYLSTDLSSEKETLLYALGCSTNPQALNTLLEWSLEAKSGIRRQDSQTVFASVSRNPLGKDMVFDFALKNWDRMVKAFPSLYVLGRLFDSIATSLNTEDHLKNLMELSQGGKGDLGTATRSVNQAVERTQINLNWMKKHSKIVTSLANSWSKFKTFAPNLS